MAKKSNNKIFYVTVKRVSSTTFSVGAPDQKTANERALNSAYNTDWSSKEADYFLPEQDAPLFLRNVDWTDLRSQKSTLLNIISELEKKEDLRFEDLDGILHLIDAMQDYAVDEMNIPEMHVFDFELEDEREMSVPTGIKDAKGTELKTGNKTKTVYLCPNCQSDNVQIKAWVKPNEDYKFVDEVNVGDELGWCEDEQLPTYIETAELKADAKVVGFQVVGEDGTSEEGEIHPDMDASFCIYNLSQANKMLERTNLTGEQWRLLTIWEGDIEEPTMMFEGDPRD
ncbi:MAG: hypothetical protein JXB49_14330 [Bacteroidales bacterium]|nr:hypothetical protein [Bacteroidales bacterium]